MLTFRLSCTPYASNCQIYKTVQLDGLLYQQQVRFSPSILNLTVSSSYPPLLLLLDILLLRTPYIQFNVSGQSAWSAWLPSTTALTAKSNKHNNRLPRSKRSVHAPFMHAMLPLTETIERRAKNRKMVTQLQYPE